MANRFASKYLWGKETTSGTAVVADTQLVGPEIKAIDPDREPKFHDDNLGVRAKSSRVSMGNYLFNHTIAVPDLYFQLLPMIFSCGLKGGLSPSEVNVGEADYQWINSPTLTGSNSLNSITLELGDDTQAYESEYGMFERIRLNAQIAQGRGYSAVGLEADFFGRQLTATSFTGGISVPSVTPVNAKLSRIYVDSAWANLGNTEKTALLRAWELEIITGAHPKFLGSANSYWDTHGQSFIEVMLTLTMERGSTSDAEWDTFQAGTEQAIRIEIDSGVQIGAGANHKLTLDMWGAYEYVRPLDSEDQGNNIDVALFHGMYDETAGDLFDVNTVTNVSAI